MSARRPWLGSLVPVYRAGLVLKNGLLERGWTRPRRLGWPVISVGSLSAGGAGKTPVVAMLAKALAERGFGVDVLSRGYGRRRTAVERVVLSEDGRDAERFGDEPVELALGGASVFVGADRFAAGRMAEGAHSGTRGVHLLDDGFQHRKLVRALDVVLLTRADLEDHLLPAGNLREPLTALRRAGVIVVREDEGLEGFAAASGAAVWVIRRRLALPDAMPGRASAFCGIARPEGFFAMLAGAGETPVGTLAFADHHPYGRGDLDRLVVAARAVGASGFVTTAKDAAKLGGAARARLEEIGPVAVARLGVDLLDEETALKTVLFGLGENR